MAKNPTILWLRHDLRFDDNPAMRAAADGDAPVICLFILDEDTAGPHGIGSAQKWWLHHSLTAFQKDLETRDGALILRRGDAREILPQIVQDTGADKVIWTRRYMEWQVEVDASIKDELEQSGIATESVNGSLLNEPWAIKTKSDTFYKVYTPYWKQVWDRDDIRPALPRVDKLESPSSLPASDELDDWDLPPKNPNWAKGFVPVWTPGEKGARAQWREWLEAHSNDYSDHRNRPDLDETTRLSPHLHWGEISPITLWHDMRDAMAEGDTQTDEGKKFLSEIVWREFSYQLLYHHPDMHTVPLNEKFKDFDWKTDKQALSAWQKGQTGYPIVDAGMRQLWTEGWMHNRVRMIVASFLIKDLLVDWRIGQKWFWDTLVDADPANNTASWQWVAGCGADAAPFFRIFNPISQGEKFDPNGDYVRKYVPELADLPTKRIHSPWTADKDELSAANVSLGKTYPRPIVDHGKRRKLALERFEAIK